MKLKENGNPQELLLSVLDVLAMKSEPGTVPLRSAEPDIALIFSSNKFIPAGFYEFLAWIEDTEAYKRLYAETLRQPPLDSCCFCGGNPRAPDLIMLLNDWKIQEKCFSLLITNLKNLKSVSDAELLFDSLPNVMSAFHLVNTWRPGSPPDWEVRRRSIVAGRAAKRCEDCGKPDDGSLDAYHIKPIKRGGNHAFVNLICLCNTCQPQYLLDQTLGTEDADHKRRTFTHKKTELFDTALREGRDIRFTYHDDKGVISIRTITPKEWRERDGAHYIMGFCYLLNDIGIFNIRAITEMSIV